MIERTDRNDITENALAAEPIDPTDANEPIDPMENALPTDPIEQNEYLEPIDRNEPSDHSDHFDAEVQGGDSGIARPYSRVAGIVG